MFRMRRLLEIHYTSTITNSSSINDSNSNTNRTVTQSMLDADFDEDENDVDELECYISEKPANKDTDVLAWWKVKNMLIMNKFVRMHINVS